MKSLATTILLLTRPTLAQDASTPRSVLTTMCEVCTDGPAHAETASRTLAKTEIQQQEEGCKTYTTPLNQCYNARTLFPGDESWSSFDIYDTMSMLSMKRTFYESEDGSCSKNALEARDPSDATEARRGAGREFADGGAVGPMGGALRGFHLDKFIMQEGGDDYFILPFDQCVGPFGPPRPWGKFTLVQGVDDLPSGVNWIDEE